jgi:hypothetical protein
VRLLTARLEKLPPTQFILLVGLAAGVLDGVPTLLVGNTSSAGTRPIHLLAVAATTVLWWCAAVLLWWVAVRRRRVSVWKTAWHVMLGWALGDVLALALAFVAASIDTHGGFVNAYVHAPLSATLPGLVGPTLLRSPIRFLGSAVLVAFGRYLLRSAGPSTPHSLTSGDPNCT